MFFGYILFFFFFKQKTAYEMRISDWSSDVCSSDLAAGAAGVGGRHQGAARRAGRSGLRDGDRTGAAARPAALPQGPRGPPGQAGERPGGGRSGEGRVGKGCVRTGRSRGSPEHLKKNRTEDKKNTNK